MKKRYIAYALLTGLLALGGTAQNLAFAQESNDAVSSGIYEIASVLDTGFVLDHEYCTVRDDRGFNGQLQMYRSQDVNQEKFYIRMLDDDHCVISVLDSGKVITSEAAEPDYGSEGQEDTRTVTGTASLSQLVLETESTAETEASSQAANDDGDNSGFTEDTVSVLESVHENQIWNIHRNADGTCFISSQSDGYLTLDGDDLYNGANLYLAPYSGRDNQRWVLTETWISDQEHADTDLINHYAVDGKYENMKLQVYLHGSWETLDAETVASWIKETEDHNLSDWSEGLRRYVESLAEKYDTNGQPRKFTTSYGQTITLFKGSYGWKMNIDKTVLKLAEATMSEGIAFAGPVWDQEGRTGSDDNDIGTSYVEVDLSGQKVWLYLGGEQILETDCVTGTYGTDRQTPGGVYRIFYKQSPAVLNGPGYSSPVSYWMPFNGGIGLHDASWRSEFGGDIYLTNGSHGCVNLPHDAAETIYESVSIGFPVVCYN